MALSPQDNEKLLQQIKAPSEGKTNWNKYQSDPTPQTRNRHLNHFIDPSFQGIYGFFVLSFENDAHRRSCKRYFLSTIEIKDCNVMIVGKKVFNEPVKNDLIT